MPEIRLFFLKVLILVGGVVFSSVQSLSCIWLFSTLWTIAHQASLSITNSQSLPKPMSIESVMPSKHLILCCPLLLLPSIFASIRVFCYVSALRIRWPNIGVSASTSVLPMNTQDWPPLGGVMIPCLFYDTEITLLLKDIFVSKSCLKSVKTIRIYFKSWKGERSWVNGTK